VHGRSSWANSIDILLSVNREDSCTGLRDELRPLRRVLEPSGILRCSYFPGEGFREIALSRRHPQQRILPQLLVIVQVFVTESQTVNALRQHLFQRVLDPLRLPVVGEATSYAPQQADLAIGLAQEQRTALRGQPTPLELGHHLT
jgi:hypothetical protein